MTGTIDVNKQRKSEPWFVRLSIPTIDRIERLMADFGYRSRDVFLDHAITVLDAVRNGREVPACVDEARRRRADALLKASGDKP